MPSAQAIATPLVHREDKGRPMGLADAQIAGTCLTHHAGLATRNTSDFTGIPHLTLVNPLT